MAIGSFADKNVEEFFISGKTGKKIGWKNISNVVRRKLDMVHYSKNLEDLRSPPANRLEALKGDREGFYSIRINDQWRVTFQWRLGEALEVNVIDYH